MISEGIFQALIIDFSKKKKKKTEKEKWYEKLTLPVPSIENFNIYKNCNI